MSSLAATQADGYYVGTAYFDSGAYKKQSKNDWHRKQRNKEQASANSKTDNHEAKQLVVRFELPYSGRCVGCNAFIMRGTRYNATKIKTDETYFTTPIHEFRMKCRACQECEFIIRTNPQARGFDYVSGIRRKMGDEESADGMLMASKAAPTAPVSATANSTMELLEQKQLGHRVAITEMEQLQMLQTSNRSLYEHDADGNARIRTVFRKDRKLRHQRLQQGQALGWRNGMPLLEASLEDTCQAKASVFGDVKQRERLSWQKSNRQSVFNGGTNLTTIGKTKCRNSIADDKASARPDGVVSAATVTSRRRSRRATTTMVDLTIPDDPIPASQRKRKRLLLTTPTGVIQTMPVASLKSAPSALDSLRDCYGSEDSD
ncbi:hypothetical protein MPSEU_000840000 [Mayamaea pseudoterrestris]|nr:hypothetical protein MPSEU_000840000 [Mayamaea pseudoterrestris]